MRIPYFKFCNLHAEALVRKKGLTALLRCKLNALLKQSVTHQTKSLVTEDACHLGCIVVWLDRRLSYKRRHCIPPDGYVHEDVRSNP